MTINVFVLGEFSPIFDLKNMISTSTKQKKTKKTC